MRKLKIIYLLLPLIFYSCGWKDAKEVIATAERMDKTEHVVYDDTAAIAGVIRTLDNPVGWLFCSNTLGKAYYYMGRNYSLTNQIAEAAGCYIEADRLQIDDPIYRGRVNSCMAHICKQNNNSDSLALIFFERANQAFKESNNEWYYAHTLLDVIEFNCYLQHYSIADTLFQTAQSYLMDDAYYYARFLETKGLYFYSMQQYDSALVYFKQGLEYWETEEDKAYTYLKLLQVHCDMEDLASALPYAEKIVQYSQNPNYLVNAYYCLLWDATVKDDAKLLAEIAHTRADIQQTLDRGISKYAKAIPLLKEYLSNPYPWRWGWILLVTIAFVCLLAVIGVVVFRKRTVNDWGGEKPNTIKALLEIKATGISLHRFERIIHKEQYKVLQHTHYLINPNYEIKFGLRPCVLPKWLQIPYLSDFYTTAMYYLIEKQ